MSDKPEALSQDLLEEIANIKANEVAEKYRIATKQGVGGCSIVYDAWRIADGRHVAIKVLALPEGLEQEEQDLTQKRFFREAKILAALQNEHSVEVIEYGSFNAAPCVVLEFVEGRQLDDYLRNFGALPFEYAVGIISQVLEALDEAHGLGIIHRDIKPANILILEESDPPVARLIDFGIATLQEGALGEMMKTRLGVVRGTPSYMAPELFSGKIGATPESDLYAIGLVLIEMLTGTVCVSGASLMQIAFKQAHEEIVIPSLIPDCLAKIIRKCCEKLPDNRYHSAKELSKDLNECLPEAVKQRSKCEAEYLQSIKNKNSTHNKKKGLPVSVIIGIVAAVIILCSIVGYIFVKNAREEAESQKAAVEAMTKEKNAAEAALKEKAAQEELKKKAEEEEAALREKARQEAFEAEKEAAIQQAAAEAAEKAVKEIKEKQAAEAEQAKAQEQAQPKAPAAAPAPKTDNKAPKKSPQKSKKGSETTKTDNTKKDVNSFIPTTIF